MPMVKKVFAVAGSTIVGILAGGGIVGFGATLISAKKPGEGLLEMEDFNVFGDDP
jgi:hypothetical protein